MNFTSLGKSAGTNRSRPERGRLKALGFRKAEHQVHILDRLPRRPFYEVVLYCKDHRCIALLGSMAGDTDRI